MLELQIFVQRKRKMLMRLGALLVIGLAGMMAVLPRADAHASAVAPSNSWSLLLSPKPLSNEQFAAFSGPLHR